MSRKLFVSIFALALMSCQDSEGTKGSSLVSNLPLSKALDTEHILPDLAHKSSNTSAKAFSSEDEELGHHILATMDVVRAPLSPVVRLTTAQLLVGIANNIFTSLEQKKQWVTLLSIESRFDQSAESPAGAIGIGQLMPQFTQTFASHCGIKGLKPEDIKDRVVNATLSACLFRHLIENVEGNSVHLALSAYNAGFESKTYKDLKNLRNINPETANYITRFSYVTDVTERVVKESKGK